MTISIIIPTKNRYQDILNTVKSIGEQICLPDEFIIVDQNTSDDVKNCVIPLFDSFDSFKKHKTILKYIHNPQINGLTQARNRGIEKNESDIVFFFDDDVILEKDFIFNVMEIYKKHPEIFGVSGIMTNYRVGFIESILRRIFELGNFYDQRIALYINRRYKDAEYVPVSMLYGGLTSYRKEVFEEFSFDENLIKYALGEDIDFSFRVSRKYKTVIAPGARLIHVESNAGKSNDRKFKENLVFMSHYFFKKNMDKNLGNYLRFIWLNVGYLVNSIILAAKMNIDFLIGNIIGLKKLIKGGECEFIRSSKQ